MSFNTNMTSLKELVSLFNLKKESFPFADRGDGQKISKECTCKCTIKGTVAGPCFIHQRGNR